MAETFMLFVYGTLRKYENNHHLLKGSRCLAEQSWAYGELYDSGLGYPAMKPSIDSKVYGEIFEVSKSQLQEIDFLED